MRRRQILEERAHLGGRTLTSVPKGARSGGEGLERSCREPGESWIASHRPVDGVELFSAWFTGAPYARHRHDTYAVGVTDGGVQVFDYRGAVHTSLAGQVVVLYPDELHDGRAGIADGFGYRIVYIEPARLVEAVRVLRGRAWPLPFVREAVSANARLARVIDTAFGGPLEPLAIDGVILDVAEGLIGAEKAPGPMASRRVDVAAVERARNFLDVERTRVVRSSELESLTGLTRYELARQFRLLLGTSPHRYLVMRRLELARDRMHADRPLAEVAYDAGFADQAHFTRAFKSAFGLTPARYRALRAARV